MRHFKARELLAYDLEKIWELNNYGMIEIEFDDGETIQTNGRRTIYSRYCWEIHARYPKTPLLRRHHIGDKVLGTKTHLDLMAEGLWDCYDYHLHTSTPSDLEELSKLAYEVTNWLFNDLSLNTEEYVTSISALDFVRVLKHPRIKAANDFIQEKPFVREVDIAKAQSEIKKTLLDPNEFCDNTIADAAKSGMVSIGQILQCIGPRGMTTDIDSHIFRKAIRTGFAKGLRTLEDVLKESRSASKSLYFQKDPMRRSEYFNRNIQLSTATLCNLHNCDCGSRDYIPVTINSQKLLRDMLGIHYYDAEHGRELTIRRGHNHLVGKTIMIRSVFTCKHPDPYGVCVRCFGELGLSIPHGTNLGHVSASELQSKVAQLLLSSKHLDGSATSDTIHISDFDKQFITTGKEENNLYIAKALRGTSYRLCVSESEAPNLTDIKTVSNSEHLIPYRLSELTCVYFEVTAADGSIVTYPVVISTDARPAYLSRHMLRYLQKKSWIIDGDGRYSFDMADWNTDNPFAELPLKHFSTVDYMLHIESFIKGGGTKNKKSIMSYDTPIQALMAFHDLASLKLDCHLSYLQIIILATMAQNRDERDYNLPMPREVGLPTRYRAQMRLRSLAAAMAYQGQADVLYSMDAFLIKSRPRHYLDYLLKG